MLETATAENSRYESQKLGGRHGVGMGDCRKPVAPDRPWPQPFLIDRILYHRKEMVADLVISLLPQLGPRWRKFEALGVVHNGAVIGGVVFHDLSSRSG